MASMLANIQGLVTPAILSSVIGPSGEPEYAVKKGFGHPRDYRDDRGRSDDPGS
jgi:hypothetical protein